MFDRKKNKIKMFPTAFDIVPQIPEMEDADGKSQRHDLAIRHSFYVFVRRMHKKYEQNIVGFIFKYISSTV